jgi:hypothetical protein
MKSGTTTCASRDILSSRWRVFLLYGLPAVAIVAVGRLAISNRWRSVVWAVALATMGMACIVNALRCGRVHCYLTGPFFVLMVLAALSYGFGILHLGGNGWNRLGVIALRRYRPVVSAQMFLGRYRKGRADTDKPR